MPADSYGLVYETLLVVYATPPTHNINNIPNLRKELIARFINPFTDIGFKRIFGQEISKPLIIDFLNSLMSGEERIANISFLDKEQPALYEDDRSLIYDIYCQTDQGKNIIVEMQNKSQPYFKNRSVYYISEAIARQGERGSSWKYSIDAVYRLSQLLPDGFRQEISDRCDTCRQENASALHRQSTHELHAIATVQQGR